MKWTVGDTHTIYDCPWFRVDRTDITLPDGRDLQHHVIRVPNNAVAVLPVDDSGAVLLLYRHRFITDRWGWEIPAGSADPGEDPPTAAAREFAEETGLTCRHLQPLARADLSNGLTDQHVQIYRATGLTTTAEITSPEESSEQRWHTPGEINSLVNGDEIPDAITQLALLHHTLTRQQ